MLGATVHDSYCGVQAPLGEGGRVGSLEGGERRGETKTVSEACQTCVCWPSLTLTSVRLAAPVLLSYLDSLATLPQLTPIHRSHAGMTGSFFDSVGPLCLDYIMAVHSKVSCLHLHE